MSLYVKVICEDGLDDIEFGLGQERGSVEDWEDSMTRSI